MIPKKIHYCWFGGNEMSPLQQACLKTWKKHLVDYEFIRWDESNCPQNDFIDHHLKERNWAFVSDYVRLYALYTQGGIYLDTDFEVLKPFDNLLPGEGFLAYEDQKHINNAIAGSVKGNHFYKACMEYMLERFNNKESYHISPIVTTNVYKAGDYNIKVYDSQYFYPYNPYDASRPIKKLMVDMLTENTYAIHHWAKSWELKEMPEYKGTGLCVLMKDIFRKIGLKL